MLSDPVNVVGSLLRRVLVGMEKLRLSIGWLMRQFRQPRLAVLTKSSSWCKQMILRHFEIVAPHVMQNDVSYDESTGTRTDY